MNQQPLQLPWPAFPSVSVNVGALGGWVSLAQAVIVVDDGGGSLQLLTATQKS